jgi:hypothetical protein
LAEKIAVVGPRRGADLEAVEMFVREMRNTNYCSILVSGGAEGVDQKAEQTWIALGGKVWSYRIRKTGADKYEIEKWEIDPHGRSRVYLLLNEPSFLDPVSALHYRSMIVAEVADRVVAFAGIDRMRGTDFTIWVAKEGEQKPVHLWKDGWQ